MNLKEHLEIIGAPADFREWANGRTAQQAWDECPWPHWLLFWASAADPELDHSRGIKLASLDIAHVISHPAVEPIPDWAGIIADTWEYDPQNPKRLSAWKEWSKWAISINDNGVRFCEGIRFRLAIPWKEDGT